MFQTDGPLKIEKIYCGSDERVSIELSDGSCLKINAEIFASFSLHPGDTVDEFTLPELQKAGKISEAYAKALNYLSYRSRSEKEITRKLSEYPVSVVGEVVSRLAASRLIDDREFARRWIDERSELKGLGRRRLFVELLGKGVDREIIDDELEKLEGETHRAKVLIEAKISRLEMSNDRLSDEELRRKIYSFMVRKGYDSDLIRQLISEVLSFGGEENASREI